MKFASGSEKLEMRIFKREKKDMEGTAGQSVSVPVIHYNHESNPRERLSEEMEHKLLQQSQQLFNSESRSLSGKDDAKNNLQPVFIGNEGPSVIVKATVCIIAFVVMIICLCFLFV